MLICTPKMRRSAQTRGAIGYFMIEPDIYLDLTSNKSRDKIEKESLTLDDYNSFIENGAIDCMPYIKILPSGKVVGHEGRHRAQAVKNAGGKYVEVALIIVQKNPNAPKNANRRDKYVPYENKFNVADIPTIWKAQFTNESIPVRLYKFRSTR